MFLSVASHKHSSTQALKHPKSLQGQNNWSYKHEFAACIPHGAYTQPALCHSLHSSCIALCYYVIPTGETIQSKGPWLQIFGPSATTLSSHA